MGIRVRSIQKKYLIHKELDGDKVNYKTTYTELSKRDFAKIKEVVSRVFSIDLSKIKSETTNTSRSANTSPTAASSGADLNCGAVQNACNKILDRLKSSALEELKKDDISKIEIKDEYVYY